jgi:hypothetical protein
MDQNKFNTDHIYQICETYDQEILNSLGIPVDCYGNVRCNCPIHKGDNNTAFTYKSSTKKWGCWTQHCHKKYGSNILGLIMGIKNFTVKESIQYILRVTNKSNMKINHLDLNRKLFIRENSVKLYNSDHLFDSSILINLDYNVDYFIQRGFLLNTLKEFSAFYCNNKSKPLYGRACITLFNQNNQVIGFSGRKTPSIDKSDSNDKIPKWKHLPEGIHTDRHLFGLNKNKKFIQSTGVVILHEGPLDVMRMYESGCFLSVATLSNQISNDQINLLVENKVHTIINGFDNDEGGNIGTSRILDKSRLYFNVYDIRDVFTDDPGDMSIEKIQKDILPEIDKIIKIES